MAHAVKKGCPVAAYVWDYGGRVQFMRHFWNAAAALDPSAAALDEGRRFPLCNPEPVSYTHLDVYKRQRQPSAKMP